MSFLLRISLGKLLPSVNISLAFFAAVTVGVASFFSAQSALTEGAEAKLTGAAVAKTKTLEILFDRIEQDVLTLSNSPVLHSIMGNLTIGWDFWMETLKIR